MESERHYLANRSETRPDAREAIEMLLMPDAGSAIIAPFCEVPTLSLVLDEV